MKLLRNKHQVDVDFLLLTEEQTDTGLMWSGYWVLRRNMQILAGGLDRFRVPVKADWTVLDDDFEYGEYGREGKAEV